MDTQNMSIIFKEALEDYESGIILSRERQNNIPYAGDTVLFADKMEHSGRHTFLVKGQISNVRHH
jgi:hypothetical protein